MSVAFPNPALIGLDLGRLACNLLDGCDLDDVEMASIRKEILKQGDDHLRQLNIDERVADAAIDGPPGATPTSRPTGIPTPTRPATPTEGSTPQPTAPANVITHEVIFGETLTSITVQYGVPVEDIVALNGIADVNIIIPGQQLRIPVSGPISP